MKLPIVGFYLVVPWLFLLFHFNLLLQFTLLSQKFQFFQEFLKTLSDEQGAALQRRFLNFPLLQMLMGQRNDRFMQWVLALIIWITIIVMPLGLLMWAQLAFAAYHHKGFTFMQWMAVVFDAWILTLFWPRIASSQSSTQWWWGEAVKQTSAILRKLLRPIAIWRTFHIEAKVLSAIYFSAVFASSMLTIAPSGVSLAGLDRNLDLVEKVLTANTLPAKVITHLSGDDEEKRKSAFEVVLGINLQERDLRYANFSGSILPKADLRRAELQGAHLWEANLQGADLRWAELQGAFLGRANFQSADLWGAKIGGADFESARLDLVDLRSLDHTPLSETQYQKLSDEIAAITHKGPIAYVLERLQERIGQEDTLDWMLTA